MRRTQSIYLFDPEINAGKMIFLSGPRQVGKTTLVKNRLKQIGNGELYFDWDDPYIRREYTKNPHFLKAYLARARGEFPLVAFDVSGNRVGMGGGFYDRTLAYLQHRRYWRKPVLAGLAHEIQKVAQLDTQSWDIPLDYVITEKQIYKDKNN